jgi:putative FmdB family regulatory protein
MAAGSRPFLFAVGPLEVLMPLYEYACQDCGHHFEVRQNIRDEPLTICPLCGGPIRRVVQPVGIVFKGSGFYKTDSRTTSGTSLPAGERKTEDSSTKETGAATPSTAAASSSASSSATAKSGSAPAATS